MNRILMLDVNQHEFIEVIKRVFPELEVARRPEDAEIISVAWSHVDPTKYRRLRYLVNRSAGTDHIDYGKARLCGVKVLQISDYCSGEVADYTIRAINKAGELAPVAVVGTGRIGSMVTLLLRDKGYPVHILHHDSMELDIATVLPQCRYITLHMPLTRESTHWLRAARISYLGGAILINTARAGLVDEPALLHGIDRGHIERAYLDVAVSRELRRHPAVEYTGHTAYQSEKSRRVRADMTIQLLREALDGLQAGQH